MISTQKPPTQCDQQNALGPVVPEVHSMQITSSKLPAGTSSRMVAKGVVLHRRCTRGWRQGRSSRIQRIESHRLDKAGWLTLSRPWSPEENSPFTGEFPQACVRLCVCGCLWCAAPALKVRYPRGRWGPMQSTQLNFRGGSRHGHYDFSA